MKLNGIFGDIHSVIGGMDLNNASAAGIIGVIRGFDSPVHKMAAAAIFSLAYPYRVDGGAVYARKDMESETDLFARAEDAESNARGLEMAARAARREVRACLILRSRGEDGTHGDFLALVEDIAERGATWDADESEYIAEWIKRAASCAKSLAVQAAKDDALAARSARHAAASARAFSASAYRQAA